MVPSVWKAKLINKCHRPGPDHKRCHPTYAEIQTDGTLVHLGGLKRPIEVPCVVIKASISHVCVQCRVICTCIYTHMLSCGYEIASEPSVPLISILSYSSNMGLWLVWKGDYSVYYKTNWQVFDWSSKGVGEWGNSKGEPMVSVNRKVF